MAIALDIDGLTDDTRRFDTGIVTRGGTLPVVLIVKCGGPSNKLLVNAQGRLAKGRRARMSSGVITAETLLADRLEDARLYAAHVVTGWENATEPDGKPAGPTRENIEGFLGLLAKKRPQTFQLFAGYVGDESNFVESLGDPAELGK